MNDIGSVIAKLLGGQKKEVRIEITCKVLDDSLPTAPSEVADEKRGIEQPDAAGSVAAKRKKLQRPYNPEDRIDGIDALASYMGCSSATVQKLKNRKELPCYDLGSRVYFYIDEINEWINSKTVNAASGNTLYRQIKVNA